MREKRSMEVFGVRHCAHVLCSVSVVLLLRVAIIITTITTTIIIVVNT